MNSILWNIAGFCIVAMSFNLYIFSLISRREFFCATSTGVVVSFGSDIIAHKGLVSYGVDSAVVAVYLYLWWKHRDDDNEPKNRKRLKNWAKNKLQKFANVALRPIEKGSQV